MAAWARRSGGIFRIRLHSKQRADGRDKYTDNKQCRRIIGQIVHNIASLRICHIVLSYICQTPEPGECSRVHEIISDGMYCSADGLLLQDCP